MRVLQIVLLAALLLLRTAAAAPRHNTNTTHRNTPSHNTEGGGGDRFNKTKASNKKYDQWAFTSGKWNTEIVYLWDTVSPVKYQDKVMEGFQWFEENTCLRFYHEHSSEAYGVDQTSTMKFKGEGNACWAFLGASQGVRQINYGDKYCYRVRTVIHEILHSLGMPHTQARFDRDRFLTVNFGNIDQGHRSNYDKVNFEDFAIYQPYDYTSVMHYKDSGFAVDNTIPTMEPIPALISLQPLIGRQHEDYNKKTYPTHYGTAAINQYYGCNSHCASVNPCANDGWLDASCQCKCPRGLAGPTCEDIDQSGEFSQPGCGGVYKMMSVGESYTFGTVPRSHKSKDCAFIFASEPGNQIHLTCSHLSLQKYEDHFEVRWHMPGQRGVYLYPSSWYPPTPPVETATSNGDYWRRPIMSVHAIPTKHHVESAQSEIKFDCTVTVSQDTSMQNAYFSNGGEEDWQDLYYIWHSSRPITEKSLARSTDQYNSGQYSMCISPTSGATEWLQTTTMWDGSSSSVCANFDYFGTGSSSTTLEIQSLRRDDSAISTHDTINDNFYTWQSRSLSISESGWFAVRFSYGPGSYSSDNMYLDNVVISQCAGGSSGGSSGGSGGGGVIAPPPPPPTQSPPQTQSLYTTDFENWDSFSTWMATGNIAYAWTLQSGGTPSGGTGPESGNGGSAFYVFLECSGNFDESASLTPPFIASGNEDVCIEFYWHMKGNTFGELTVHTRDHQSHSMTQIFSKTQADTSPHWQRADITVPATYAPYEVVFKGECGFAYESDIAIDDVTISSCSGSSAGGSGSSGGSGGSGSGGGWGGGGSGGGGSSEVISMDFEDWSLWDSEFTQRGTLSSPDDDGNYWTHWSGSTWSSGTGPYNAHGGSYYIYMETSYPNTQGEMAELVVNRVFQTSEAADVNFWASMFGTGMGHLELKSVEAYGGWGSTSYWRRDYQYDDWVEENVNIQEWAWQWQVSFQAYVGHDWQSDIALDDIIITVSSAGYSPPIVTQAPGSWGYSAHAAAVDTNLLEHSFEKHEKGFRAMGSASPPFTRISGGTLTPRTGPEKASDGEYYIYFEATGQTKGAVADFVTEKRFDGENQLCVLFDYHMYGTQTGTLEILSQDVIDSNETSHWKVSGQNVNAWQEGSAIIPPQDEYFRIVFRVTHDGGAEGDIAFDNIFVAKGPCARITVGKDCQRCASDYKANSTCHAEHLDGNVYCSAFGFARDSLWNKVDCDMTEGLRNGFASYQRSCRLPACSLGYDPTTATDKYVETLQYKTTCLDEQGFECDMCCPDHCDASGAASFSPRTVTTIVTLCLTLFQIRSVS